MKPREINEKPEWTFLLPDSIADWDAPSHWERERLASMERHLRQGMVLYDIGVEHGWLSALYGSFCGHGNMVLIEPGPEMWINIRKTWAANGFADPIACFPTFAGAHTSSSVRSKKSWRGWPSLTVGFVDADEVKAMPYRYLGDTEIETIAIDDMVKLSGHPPEAITVDVEGFELEVMRGAQKTLLNHRPLVWLSVHPDLMAQNAGVLDVDELFGFMASYGYGREYLGTDHEQHHFFAPLEWSPL